MILPEVHEKTIAEGKAELLVVAPAGSKYFDGHFPGSPVLPGVVQIGWAQQLAAEVFGVKLTVNCMRRVKFMRVIRPDQDIRLELQLDAAQLAFRYYDENGNYSSGLLDVDVAR